MKKLILAAFALMILVQWAVPVKMILDSEAVLDDGVIYNFKTQPIDPSDPFRGKYVTLNFEENNLKTDTLYMYKRGEIVYVMLSVDSAGFVKVTGLSPDAPSDQTENFIQTKVGYASQYNGIQTIHFDYSFDRFYVEESKASTAEQAYWGAQRDSSQVAYAVIKVKDGQGIVADVMINGKPILEVVREMNENQPQK